MSTANAATDPWPSVNYSEQSATCDTPRAHSQLLGKLPALLASAEGTPPPLR